MRMLFIIFVLLVMICPFQAQAQQTIQEYQQSCNTGSNKACFNLGLKYLDGNGVLQSDLKATELWVKSCYLGHVNACNNAAYMHEKGRGVTKNPSKAISLYRKGCNRGDTTACKSLKNLEKKEKPSPPYPRIASSGINNGQTACQVAEPSCKACQSYKGSASELGNCAILECFVPVSDCLESQGEPTAIEDQLVQFPQCDYCKSQEAAAETDWRASGWDEKYRALLQCQLKQKVCILDAANESSKPSYSRDTNATQSEFAPATRCECSYDNWVGTCQANIEQKNKWITILSNTKQCSRVDWYSDSTPQVTIVTDGAEVEPWLGQNVPGKLSIDSCNICKDNAIGK